MNSDILSLEQGIKDAEELVARRDMAMRLSQHRDFRKIFMDDYFVTEAARLVQLSADPALTQEQRGDALNMAQATGHAKRYLSMMIRMGSHAEEELPEMRATLEELRSFETEE